MPGQEHRPLANVAPKRASGGGPSGGEGGVGMSAMRDLIKGSGGDASSAFEVGTMGRPITMPFQGLMEDSFGMDLGGVDVYQGPATDAALTMLGAGAAEHGGDMLLPSVGVTPELVGHETAHVAQGDQFGQAGVHASGNASRSSAASEVEAHDVGARAARGEPVSVSEPLSAGVNLWGPGEVGSRIVDAGLGWISDTATQAWDGTTEAVGDAAGWVGDTAVEAWDGTTEAVGNTVDWAENTVDDVMSGNVDGDWLENKANEVYDGVTGTATDAGGWLSNKADEAYDGVSNSVDQVSDWASERAETGWHDMTAWHYEEREALNGEHPQPGTLRDGENGWQLLPAWMSKLHDNGEGEAEEKWVNEDGREAVFDGGRDGSVMTDPRYVGTYNYVVPRDKNNLNTTDDYVDFASRTAGHTVWDVLPWIALGNTRDDPTTITDRIGMLLK